MVEAGRKRPIIPEDLFSLRLAGDPRLSPGGEEIVFVVQRTDRRTNRYYANLSLVSVADGRVSPFTWGNHLDLSPRWSPDGKRIAFVSDRTGRKQIHLIDRRGGESWPVTDLPEGRLSDPAWSPDGRWIAFTFHEKRPPKGDGEGWNPGPEDWKPPAGAPPISRVIRRLRYKADSIGFLDDERDHVWVVSVPEAAGALGETRRLSSGAFDHSIPVWSPDGREIACFAVREPDADRLFPRSDLWGISFPEGEMRKIAEVCAPPIPPAWSPDGSTLALCAYTDYEHAYEWNDVHVITIRADGSGAKRVWTRSLDRLCQIYMATDIKPFGAAHSPPLWSPDGRRIYFLASDRGNGRLYSVTLPEGEISPLTHGAEVILDFHGRPDTGRFALLIADPDDPGDIFTCAVDPARGTLVEEKRRLTTMNQTHLEGIAIGRTEEVTLPSFDGTPIHGFVLYPPDFDRTKKYPLILEMHGGPHILSGNIFFHEYHVLSGAGFIVATFNHRGSQGYGEDFAAAIARDWGRIDYQDLMACVDRLCERPYVDEERLGVAGGSYGGYMTMWIVTQTDRFKAAVSFRAVSNLYSVAGTADMGFDNAREYGAQPWEDREHLFRMSPISHVQNVTTPILIVQAEEDLRCPIEQAEQFYFALEYLGKEAVLLRFPEESHELSRSGRPDRRMERLYRALNWFRRYLQPIETSNREQNG